MNYEYDDRQIKVNFEDEDWYNWTVEFLKMIKIMSTVN